MYSTLTPAPYAPLLVVFLQAQAETEASGWARAGAGVEDDRDLAPAPLLSWSVQLRIALDGSKVLHKLGAGLGKGGVDGADRERDIQALKVGWGHWAGGIYCGNRGPREIVRSS